MTGHANSTNADAAFAYVAYLRAVVNLYGPWLDLASLHPSERMRARARVGQARRELARLGAPHGVPGRA